jgi:hypothetical protein
MEERYEPGTWATQEDDIMAPGARTRVALVYGWVQSPIHPDAMQSEETDQHAIPEMLSPEEITVLEASGHQIAVDPNGELHVRLPPPGSLH